MSATVVIGANYGDEGKGLITDFEVRRLKAKYVCRFNGGAQAGHTVVSPDGARHVFGHFGAGTFAGAKTYLSSDFIINPFWMEKEYWKLRSQLKGDSVVMTHPDSRVTTIYDMVINGLAELARGDGRHGSCGAGINETVTRSDHIKIRAESLLNQDRRNDYDLAGVLEEIRNTWVPYRLDLLNIKLDRGNPEMLPMIKILDDMDFENHAAVMTHTMRQHLMAVDLLEEFGNPFKRDGGNKRGVVFEGAQGLALDEELGEFPHVTRSKTGLPQAIAAAFEMRVKELQPVYVTRCYATRHGAGPLPHEGKIVAPVDKTNVDNQWQGSIRYAPLDLPDLARRIHLDRMRGTVHASRYCINVKTPTIAVTCLDQFEKTVPIAVAKDTIVDIPVREVPAIISHFVNLELSHSSHGEDSTRVRFHDRISLNTDDEASSKPL